jgi:SAM-dependent methyltransferase
MNEGQLLSQQVKYYRARAAEYDEWFLRQGRYDQGPEHRAEWFREVALIEAALRETVPHGDVLELACGTGLWTRHLAQHDSRIVAVDASPEAVAINRGRVGSANVNYVVADVFTWVPPASRFDVVFFSFWLSHVPPGRFDEFWATVRTALKPQGRAFFIDSLLEQTSTARDHDPLDESGIARRRLNDGREFQIVKVFYEPLALERRLSERGWDGWVRSSGRFFLYGSVRPQRSALSP